MQKFGKFVTKYRNIILIIALILLIPSVIGMKATRINYDILAYLPDYIETVKGEDILTQDFGTGSYAMVLVENMPTSEMLKLENEYRKMDNVGVVGSVADVLGDSIPAEMLPDKIQDALYKDNTTIIMVTFKEGISADETMESIEKMRALADERVKISGTSSIILDVRNLSESEMIPYIIIAVILCLIILEVTLDSFVAPIFLLLNIGFAVLYNMGTNIFLGEISFITKAIAAVLQLGVTTDFAIFLYHSYMQQKENGKTSKEAMADAITTTIGSVFGSSITTIAGFLALECLVLRLTNVQISISAIVAIIAITILQFIYLSKILSNQKVTSKVFNKESVKYTLAIIPMFILSAISSVIPALSNVMLIPGNVLEIASFGMVLFWGIIIFEIFNNTITRVILTNAKNK